MIKAIPEACCEGEVTGQNRMLFYKHGSINLKPDNQHFFDSSGLTLRIFGLAVATKTQMTADFSNAQSSGMLNGKTGLPTKKLKDAATHYYDGQFI